MSRDGRDAGGSSVAARRLLWIIAYYLIGGAVIGGAWDEWGDLRDLLAKGRVTDALGTDLSAPSLAPTVGELAGGINGDITATLLVLGGALVTALPLAWVYSLTRRRRGFSQSMVHILVLLPVAVAGMVMLIQNSLALAFSLAGIVAILRFRNSLDDVKDGVYIFIAVAIGISASLHALLIGILTSVVFNVCVLVLWWLDFARRPLAGVRGGWRSFARLPSVPTRPAEKVAPVPVETGDEVFASAARAWRRQLQITAEQRIATGASGTYNATVKIRSANGSQTRSGVEEVLRARTKRWELRALATGDDGRSLLTYRVGVRRSSRVELLDALQAAPHVMEVELR